MVPTLILNLGREEGSAIKAHDLDEVVITIVGKKH